MTELQSNNSGRNKRGRNNNIDLSPMIYGKVPPQNKEVEDAVLGIMMMEPSVVPTVIEKIKSSDIFYQFASQNIYDAILSIYERSGDVDILTVVDELKSQEKLDLVGGPYYLTRLQNGVVSSAHIDTYINIILETYLKRELIKISGFTINEAYEDSTDVFDLYDKADKSLINAREVVETGKKITIQRTADIVKENYLKTKETGVLGIPTQFLEYNSVFGGLVQPDMTVIAARPGQGKTAFVISVVNFICVRKGVPVAIFSLEMSAEQLVMRLIAVDAQLDHQKIREGKLSKEEEERFEESRIRIANSPLYIEDNPRLSITDIRVKTILWKKKYDIQYVAIDYLQLMLSKSQPGKNQNREQDVSDISRGVKALCKEVKIPIHALSQLSRAVEARADKMPQLSDLRESGSIEQDADNVLFIMRPEYYDFKDNVDIGGVSHSVQNLAIMKTGKSRHSNPRSFPLSYNGPSMTFINPPGIYAQNNENQQTYIPASLPFSNDGPIDDMPF